MRRYSPREVAKALGLCVATVRRLCHRGDLHGTPTGRRGHYWHIYANDLETWLQTESAKRVLAYALRYNARFQTKPSPPSTATNATTATNPNDVAGLKPMGRDGGSRK